MADSYRRYPHDMLRLTSILPLLALLWPAAPALAQAARPLTVVSAGPSGELASLAEGNEIRVVFSEPMVTIGRIPSPVRAPFFKVSPSVNGTFRWSGTTILIFMPSRPLPYATRYDVTIDASATAVSGRTLAAPYSFSFTTPTVKLLETNWYRRGGRAGAPMVILLRFNQPVRAADVLAHASASFQRHDWTAPTLPASSNARLRQMAPQAQAAFDAKVAATRAVTQSTSPIAVRLTNDWDKKRFPPANTLVAIETTTSVPPESFVGLRLDERLPSPAGRQTPSSAQQFTIEAEKAFFVEGFRCTTECDPDAWNPLQMTTDVKVTQFGSALTASAVTAAGAARSVAKPSAPRLRREYEGDQASALTLEDAGFDGQPPASTYAVSVDAGLTSANGQTLGYTWTGTIENWHERAFTSFGDGHGVWESSGGTTLPFYSRNFQSVTQWAAPIAPGNLMPRLLDLQPAFTERPQGPGVERRLGGAPDRIVSHGLDMSGALGPQGKGLVWAAVQEGAPIANSQPYGESRVRASVIQVTNLGITVKDSPANTLVFVTRLDTGAPVSGAKVSIVRTDNQVAWTGVTGQDGTVLAPSTPLRDADDWWKFSFLVTAEKDGDIAYTGSDWNEGIQPWEFGVPYNLNEASPLLRGTVFTDRGVYKLGEEARFKAVLRSNTPDGIRLLPAGTPLFISIRDGQDRNVDERTVNVNAWSSAEWTMTLPPEGTLGNYTIRVMREADRPKPRTAAQLRPGETPGPAADEYVPYFKVVDGSFLVAAYRRPDFRVDVSLTSDKPIAGSELSGVVTARYLFGAPMRTRPVTWSLTRSPMTDAPQAVHERFPGDQWVFVGTTDDEPRQPAQVRRDETQLTNAGSRALQLGTKADAGIPYSYTLEADVEDVSRQHIANRASIVVHPAEWYIGVRRPSYFVDQETGVQTQIVAVTPEGRAAAGVRVNVTLTQVQWTSVRRAEGNGFYTWDTERKEVPAGSWTVTTASDPVPLQVPVPEGGYFILQARANGDDGRYAVTTTSFYALGTGYTAWQRFDHNRIDIVPERQTYKPGETARLMIQSPWEQATALVTTEREGIRSHRQFALTSTQQSISIPITEADIPNVYVSVLLVKGRTATPPSGNAAQAASAAQADSSDPGKPSFRLGYAELKVEDVSKRLTVAVTADKQEYRPGNEATVTLDVKDQQGRGTASEVTLWAVDYGVLSLTGYRTPDVLGSVYVEKALQVMTTDNRQRIVSRRVLTPKGETDGGGGGLDAGAGTLRKDFRVLAFWVGSVVTDASGHAKVEVKLPESLTTYRIMAVAADRSSRFGAGDAEVRINKPVTLAPTFPRFLAVGDKASFGAVVTSQLQSAGSAVVTIESLDPDVLLFNGAAAQTLPIAAGGSIEARFDAAGRAVGRARVRMTVKVGDETDAFEDAIPVEVLASPETVATYGTAPATGTPASESLALPAGIVPGFGGLHVELASTAMVGLGEGARYLVEYPYGCAEQRGSRALALLLSADLGEAFVLPGIDPANIKPVVQQALNEMEKYQCPSGGFAYWAGDCNSVSPYLTAYLLDVFKAAADLHYTVDARMRARAYDYLEQALSQAPPSNEGWWPSYTAWQAFAVKVLVEGGRNQDSNLTRLYGYRERMPVFALAYLYDALVAQGSTRGQTPARLADLRRRMSNAILPEAGSAHVEELSDPYLLWFWNSNVRSTAIVLGTLVRAGADQAQIQPMVRWLMSVRKDGRWGNTQENAYALAALAAYYRKYESVTPSFEAVVRLAGEEIAREPFRGRSTEAKAETIPMPELVSKTQPGTPAPLTFSKEGTGTLFYTARLRYAADRLFEEGLDSGFQIERTYAPYLEGGLRPASTAYKAGDLVRVTLALTLTKERRFVAVTDPLPAGFEPVESWFATTAAALSAAQDDQGSVGEDWTAWWQRGGFDHVERHDDRVQLFATRLSEGRHEFTYIARATTAGTFRTAPARAEEMYEPEVFGRTKTAVIEVRK